MVCGPPPPTPHSSASSSVSSMLLWLRLQTPHRLSLLWLSWNFLLIFLLMQMFQTYRGCVSVPLDAAVHQSSCWSTQRLCFRDAGCLFLLRVIRLELSVRRTRESSLSCFCSFLHSGPVWTKSPIVQRVPSTLTGSQGHFAASLICHQTPSTAFPVCSVCLSLVISQLFLRPLLPASGSFDTWSWDAWTRCNKPSTRQQTVHAAHVT